MELKENIVISGLSGRYPECNHVEEFREALFNGVDLVTNDGAGYPPGALDTPVRLGRVPYAEKFDAAFFGIHPKQAEYMDPRQRKLLESVYECIIDAGYNPQELRGTKTGVYVGITSFSNAEILLEENTSGYSNIGMSLALSANRISYCFDFKGPSYAIDTACSSSSLAFVNAFNDMKRGITDSAIVCGTQMLFHPFETLEFKRLKMLADDGKCKVFSTLRDGYVRSESVTSILLQRESQSRRIYATVLGAATNTDGYKKEGVTFPSAKMQSELIRDIYSEANIDLNNVAYVEAHGTGTPVGDLHECESIVDTFCMNRRNPLPIGSVKSNMGHSEPASGLCSITKVLIAMESGVIPASLHTKPLDTELPGIRNGKIKVVDENLAWNGGIAGINCFGFGGANAHMVLKSNTKEKVNSYKRPKSRLVLVSGRTKQAVNHFLNEIEKNQDDDEFLALVDEVHKMNVEGHNYRGYIILGNKSRREIGKYVKKRPIWFIYTGMGSHWTEMGRDLLKIPIFRRTIDRCASALEPYDVDLIDILTDTSETQFDNVTNCFCAISAVEIALTDVLYQLGIIPDGIAGHSLGEVGCSYADGQITPEEAILLGYARGYASNNIEIQPGQMAAVGLSKEECEKLLPNDIFIACQNNSTNVTITGPKQSVRDFVEKLTSQGIFAKNVNSGGIAYHSKYIKDWGPVLFNFANSVLKTPKPRSAKWISTSVPDHRKNESWAKLNCAEYHTNNFCGPVLFDQIYQHIPDDAIVIEVAPHGLMQAILKRQMKDTAINIPLTSRSSNDNEEFFLSSLGKIYIAGGVPNLRNFYTKVTFPVSRGTKMLSPIIEWDHRTNWFNPYWKNKDSFGEVVTINLSDQKYKYLEGHYIDGRVLMPTAGYVELLWQVFGHMLTKNVEDLPVVIENMEFMRATILPANQDVKFLINIMKHSGNFEIFEGGSVVTAGRIWSPKDITAEFINPNRPTATKDNYLPLNRNDFYKECHLRRYMYNGLFQGIKECDVHGLHGKIEWKGSFTSFLDSMLQLNLLKSPIRELLVPRSMEQLIIDPVKHLKNIAQGKELDVYNNQYLNIISSEAIEIVGVEFARAPQRRKAQEDPILETYEFVPYVSPDTTNLDNALYTALQIILQNCKGLIKSLKICEVPRKNDSTLINSIKQILDTQASADIEYIEYDQNHNNDCDVIVTSDREVDQIDKQTISNHIKEKGFVLYVGDIFKAEKFGLQIVYKAICNASAVCLLRPDYPFPDSYTVINVRNSDFDWLEKIKNVIKYKQSEVAYLFSHGSEVSGLIGLTKCLLTEPIETKFRSVLVLDEDEEMFSVDEEFYRHQLRKDLTINVLKDRQWGTFVHLPVKELGHRKVKNASTTMVTPGDLSSLRWMEKPCTYVKPDPRSLLVHVFYSALNFRDVMVTTGRLEPPRFNDPTVPEVSVGLEYAGVTNNGKRVMGMVPCEGLGLTLQSHPVLTWEVPRSWSLEDAATVPCVYSTCYYAMVVKAQIRPGESILIHAGSGGVGITAISIALGMECTIFITVGSPEKRDFIKKLYPQLKDENIGDSRSKMFKKMVMQNTKGNGVDLVLNSLTEDLFQESLRCVARRGRFMEIGKTDFFNGTPINSKMFLKNCSFHSVLMEDLFDVYDSEHLQQIKYLLEEGIRKGIVKPLPRKSFSETEVENAFRYLSSSKHTGNILIQIRKEDPITIQSPTRTISAIPKVYFDPEKSYILIGGLGGFGLEVTDWMIRKGATKLVLNSRRGVSDGYQSFCLKKWSQYKGIIVKVSTDETSTLEGAKRLVVEAQKLGPVGGVFNMALNLHDALFENQTKEMYEKVFSSKITSGQNMDIVTRTVCPQLDHFVVFSSFACGRGNLGQTNYGMANSALEMLCMKRKKENLPGLVIQLGIIGDVGVLAKGIHYNALGRVIPQNVQSCLNALENFMLQSATIGSSYVLANKNMVTTTTSAKTPIEIVAHIIGLKDVDLVDQDVTLTRLGLDTLMVTEIKQTLYRSFQIELSTDEIQNLTFNNLSKIQNLKHNTFPAATPAVNGDLCETFNAIISKQAIVKLADAGPNERTIFLIHPVEGKVDILRNIGGRLKALVYGLECTRDANYDELQDCAGYFIKQIKSKQPRGPYMLCGYSFGGVLAFEMALQLENNGDDVTIVSIEGAPVYIKNIIENRFVRNSKSLEKAKADVLKAFSGTLASLNQSRVNELLETSTDWEKQVEILSNLISEETGLDAGEVALSAKMYFNRCKAVYYYEPKKTFKGKLSLIRRADNQYLLPEDYDLEKICRQKVDVLKLEGDHLTVLLGNNAKVISDKINEILK